MPKQERMNRGWLKIGELAKKLGVPVTTIRYYTEIGLLPVIAETQGGYRLYDHQEAASRLVFIRRVSGNHPTLKETRQMLNNAQTGETVAA